MVVDRCSRFLYNGIYKKFPLVKLSKKRSDYFEIYRRGMTSLCNLSHKYYNSPDYDWLILLANREYGSLEYSIPDGAELRIPYPLDDTLTEYDGKVIEMLTNAGY